MKHKQKRFLLLPAIIVAVIFAAVGVYTLAERDTNNNSNEPESELIIENSVAVNGLYVSGPDKQAVLDAIEEHGGKILKTDEVLGGLTYTIIFESVDNLDDLIVIRDKISEIRGITAGLITYASVPI